jgi:hypothetical protein
MDKLSIIGCIGEAWDYFKKRPALAIGGFIVYFALMFVGSVIPFLGLIFSVFVAPALIGGFMLLFLNLAGNDEPKLDDLFDGFSRYWAMMGLYWLITAGVLIGLLPTLIYAFIAGVAQGLTGANMTGLSTGFFVLYVINLLALLIVMMRFAFSWFVLLDDPRAGVIDALKMSAFLTKGQFVRVLLLFVTIAVLSFVSLFLLIVGYFVAAPIMGIAYARAYLNLKNIKFHTSRRTPPTPAPVPPQPEHAPLPSE